MNFLIDTSIIIDHFRGGNHWTTFLDEIKESDKLYVTSITIFELYCGLSSKEVIFSNKIKLFQSYLNQIDLNLDIAKKAGEIYRDNIKGLEVPDYIIAASAIEVGAQVVTLNTKHFKQISNLMLYPYEKIQ